MKITHHPDVSTLMSFSSGTLGESLSAVVAAHLDVCPQCRSTMRKLNAIGAALLEQVEGADVRPSDARQRLMDAKRRSETAVALPNHMAANDDGILPTSLRRHIGADVHKLAWKRLGPGVSYVPVSLSSREHGDLRLLAIEAGRRMPEHGHSGAELTLVLQGAFEDAFGRYGPGDVADMDDEHEHQPVIVSDETCICLVGTQGPARFKSLTNRLVQPLIGM